ncbi:MAG: beta strand repeat-containing protein, partial [Bacteroidota bacterium]
MKPIYSICKSSLLLKRLFALVIMVFMFSNLFADTYYWNGSGIVGGTNNSNFNLATNWLVNGVVPANIPGANDDVVIDPNNFNSSSLNSGSCVVSSSVTIKSLTCNTVFPSTSNLKKTMTIRVADNQTLTIGDLTLSCVHNVSTTTSTVDFLTGSGASVVVNGTAVIGNSTASGTRLVRVGGFTSATNNSIVFNGNATFGLQAATANTPTIISKWIFTGTTQSLAVTAPSANFNLTNVEIGTSSIPTSLSLGSSSFNVSGNWNNYGTITHNSGTVTFNGAVGQLLDGGVASQLYNVTLNNAAGVTISQNLVIAGTLTLSNGKINTGSSTVIVQNGGSISGANTSRYINGNLTMPLAAGVNPSTTLPIGDATNYTPVSLNLTGTLASANTITAYTTLGTPVNPIGSGLNATLMLGRYYSLSSASAITGISNINGTFNFGGTDIPSGANYSNFIVRKNENSNWETTTLVSADASSTTASFTGLGEFAIGEANTITISCSGNQTIYTTQNNCVGSIELNGLSASNSIPTATISYSPLSGSNLPLGVTNYTATATNINGSSSCTFNVTVVDTVKPTITCPSNLQMCTTTGSYTFSDLGSPVVLDNCTATNSLTVVNDAPSLTFNVGVNTVNWTVTDASGNNRSCAQTITIFANPIPSITTNRTTINCTNPTASLDPGSYSSYAWSTGATTQNITAATQSIASTNYSVIVTDANGCTGTASVAIAEDFVNPSVVITPASTRLHCNNTSISLTASGAVSYVWGNGPTTSTISVTTAGTYSVVGTAANGCTTAAYQVINATTAPSVSAVVDGNYNGYGIACNGGIGTMTATITDGLTPYSYAWSGNGGTSSQSAPVTAGIYTIVITDADACTASATLTLTQPAAALTVTAGSNSPQYVGGTVNLISTVGGGVPAYSYSWTG